MTMVCCLHAAEVMVGIVICTHVYKVGNASVQAPLDTHSFQVESTTIQVFVFRLAYQQTLRLWDRWWCVYMRTLSVDTSPQH